LLLLTPRYTTVKICNDSRSRNKCSERINRHRGKAAIIDICDYRCTCLFLEMDYNDEITCFAIIIK